MYQGFAAPRSLTVAAHVLRRPQRRSEEHNPRHFHRADARIRGRDPTISLPRCCAEPPTRATGFPASRSLRSRSRGIVDCACVRVEGGASSARANHLRPPTRAGNHGLDSLMTPSEKRRAMPLERRQASAPVHRRPFESDRRSSCSGASMMRAATSKVSGSPTRPTTTVVVPTLSLDPHVLVAACDAGVREARERQLAASGLRVRLARTGFEAIVKACVPTCPA